MTVGRYYKTFKQLVNEFAPEKRRTIIERSTSPWYTKALEDAKRSRRRHERKGLSLVVQMIMMNSGATVLYIISSLLKLTLNIFQLKSNHAVQIRESFSR